MQLSYFIQHFAPRTPEGRFSALPTELLQEIATYLPDRHPVAEHAIEVKNLAALSRVSRRVRGAILPLLYREVLITSETQLKALSRSSKAVLEHVRDLNIFMTVAFLESWRANAFSSSGNPTLYDTLLKLLVQMPRLSALRMQMAELRGVRSGWGRFAMSHRNNGCYGIPIGRAMGDALRRVRISRLSSLKTIDLDGFQDIELLVRLAPNLESLGMSMSGGFAPYVNAELVWALLAAPKLRRLRYTPTSLDLDEAILEDKTSERGGSRDGESNLRLLQVIGRLAPHIEELDLRTRVYDDSISFRNRFHLIPIKALGPALAHFQSLNTILLPSTILREEESSAIRTPYTTFVFREQAMERATYLERLAVDAVGQDIPSLRSISFVRPGDPNQWTCQSVTYSIDANSKHRTPDESPSPPSLSCAFDGQYSPWPHTPSLPLRIAFEKWWVAPSGTGAELAASYFYDLDSAKSVMETLETTRILDGVRFVGDVAEAMRFVFLLLMNVVLALSVPDPGVAFSVM